MSAITLVGVPMPPSSNNCYATRAFIKNGRAFSYRHATQSLDAYKGAFGRWVHTHFPNLRQVAAALWEHEVRITCTFYFAKDRIYTKTRKAESRVKKLDVSNRVKVLHDCISDHTGIDDRWFFDTIEFKRTITDGDERVDVVLEKITL